MYFSDEEKKEGKRSLKLLGLVWLGLAMMVGGYLLGLGALSAVLFAGGGVLELIVVILFKNILFIWLGSILPIFIIYVLIGKGDFNLTLSQHPIPMIIYLVIWFLAGFPLGFLGWGEGGGAGAEKEETREHYDTWGKYRGKSIRRGDTIEHYDAWGKYRGKSKVEKK